MIGDGDRRFDMPVLLMDTFFDSAVISCDIKIQKRQLKTNQRPTILCHMNSGMIKETVKRNKLIISDYLDYITAARFKLCQLYL